MCDGHIIYDAAGAERNAWFIERLKERLRARGLNVELIITPYGSLSNPPSFAVVRTIDPGLTSDLESRGVRVFNNFKTSLIANDKWRTYKLCAEHAVPVMPTQLLTSAAEPEYPCVAKTLNGCGGKEVYWAENGRQLEILRRAAPLKQFIAQKPCSEPGIDKRVYLVGGKIIAAVLRTAKQGFKSNYSLGGNARICDCGAEEREIAEKISGLLEADFIAADFIRDGGKWVLNEVEDCAGTRMLYANSDIDAADVFAEHIARSLSAVKIE